VGKHGPASRTSPLLGVLNVSHVLIDWSAKHCVVVLLRISANQCLYSRKRKMLRVKDTPRVDMVNAAPQPIHAVLEPSLVEVHLHRGIWAAINATMIALCINGAKMPQCAHPTALNRHELSASMGIFSILAATGAAGTIASAVRLEGSGESHISHTKRLEAFKYVQTGHGLLIGFTFPPFKRFNRILATLHYARAPMEARFSWRLCDLGNSGLAYTGGHTLNSSSKACSKPDSVLCTWKKNGNET
jgi:hypothetical protein